MINYKMPLKNQDFCEIQNPLSIGVCPLKDLEERIRAFRVMNKTSMKKRYVLSREDISLSKGKGGIVEKSSEIDLSTVKLLRRNYSSDFKISIFQPDEGVTVISSLKERGGISFGIDLVSQIINIGGGSYQSLIDRVDSFRGIFQLLNRTVFPKLIVVGYISHENIEKEEEYMIRLKKQDYYLRIIEVTHSRYKPEPYFPRLKQIHINVNDERGWGRYIVEIIREYNRPYLLEVC